MVTCGNCHETNQTVEHVKTCYKQRYTTLASTPVVASGFAKTYAEARDFQPMATATKAPDVPDSHYAIETAQGLVFYRVRTGKKKDKWEGFQFVDRLTGAPGDWRSTPVMKGDRHAVLNALSQDPKAAAVRYSHEFTQCAVCGSPLSDPVSREMGLGPICAKRFG